MWAPAPCSLDNTLGIDLLVEHLVGHGHRRIGLLVGSVRETSGWERREAFVAAMQRYGLDGGPELDRAASGGRARTVTSRRSRYSRPSRGRRHSSRRASSSALGALLACRELGLRIPEDVALATFDDAYFAELLDPPLTAVAYDPSDVGRRAAELLVAAIGDGDRPRQDITVPVNLVTRRSCGCPE